MMANTGKESNSNKRISVSFGAKVLCILACRLPGRHSVKLLLECSKIV